MPDAAGLYPSGHGALPAPAPRDPAAAGTTPLVELLRLVAWALALAVPLLLALGSAPLFDVDEGAFAEASREMLASGDFGHTTLNGTDRFDKPIAVYWLQAASIALFGLGEFALRLPSALCTWLTALALAAFAAPRWGERCAALAGLVMVSSLGPLAIGRAATADALLLLCLTLSALDLARHLEQGRAAPLRRLGLWIGLGLLTKGPVALLLPAAALLIWVGAGRHWGALRRALGDPIAWGWLIGTAAPWYVYAWQRHGMAFVDGFLMRHNVERFAGALEGHGGSALYHLTLLPLLWLPWSPLLVPLLRRWREHWAEPVPRFLLGWAGFVLVFFSLSGTKLPHYGLYAAPALALLLAREAAALRSRSAWLLWTGIGLTVGAAAWAPVLVQARAGQIADPLYRALLGGAPAPVALGLAGGAMALAGLWLARSRGPQRRWHPAIAAWGTALLITGAAVPWWGEALQGPVRRAAEAARAAGEAAAALPRAERATAPAVPPLPSVPTVQWGVHWPSVAVYRGAPTPRRPPVAGELAMVRLDRLPAAPAGLSLSVVHAERGVGLVRASAVRP